MGCHSIYGENMPESVISARVSDHIAGLFLQSFDPQATRTSTQE